MFSSTKIMQALSPAGAAAGYQIARSLRFNSADTAYLSKTYGSAGNRKTWTLSLWLKRSTLGAVNNFSGSTNSGGTTGTEFFFTSGDLLTFDEYVSSALQFNLTTTQVFRDVSAWYNILFAVDTTQATASNRIKIYVNGTQVTAFGTATYPTQNLDTQFNFTSAMALGRNGSFTSGYFNGYMADVIFIDGQALTPSSFGETDSATGVWVPKAYTGTYGTNGFWLKFDDNSGTTSTTLGKDSSGNGNNWTPNNFSVTAGAGNDSLVDSPTNYGTDTGAGGEVRGNYCTLNPLAASNSSVSLTNGNLDVSIPSNVAGAMGTTAVTSGKWYWEFTAGTASQNAYYVSVADTAVWFPVGNTQNNMYLSAGVYTYYGSTGEKINNGSVSAYGATFTSGDVIGVALDMDNGAVYFSKNGTWQNSGVPTSGASKTGAAFTTLSGKTIIPWIGNGASTTSSAGTVNFGQRPFSYTAPSGFKALCTQNLPTPTIGTSSTNLADDYFNIALYTGNGTAIGSGGKAVTGLGFQPDLVWIKGRSGATDHSLFDAVRGTTKLLESNTTDAESTQSESLTTFGSDGFTVGSLAQVNTNTATYVGWAWKANGAGSSNTAGTITSTVSANTTAGISVVTYTGTGSNATVGHGIGVAPSMIIVKRRGAADTWRVYHSALGNTKFLNLNETAAAGTASTVWNNTSPTSTVFSIGTDSAVNSSSAGNTFVAYCFAEVEGFSKFGSYTGNGSTDGPFVYCGFRPRYVMIKRTDVARDWVVMDTARSTYNVVQNTLFPNSSAAEDSTLQNEDILSNGFKLRTTDASWNASSGTYIFMAFAESPFNYSRAR